MLTTLLLTALAAAEPAPTVTLTVDVARAGAVTWNDGPCRLEARRDGEVIASGTGTSLEVPPGPVLVVVTCDAKDGAVRRSQRIEVKKATTLKVSLAPGTIVAGIDKDGTRSSGQIVVYDDNDVEVQSGADKAPLLVDAGKKRVVALVDRGGTRPLRGEKQLTLKSGEKQDVVVDIADGELTVNVTENGRPAKAVIALRVPGEVRPLMELVAGTATAVPSGTWEVTTQLSETHDFREAVTRGVVVAAKQKASRSINHTTGTITIDTTPKEGVLVELFRPGAEQSFNQLDPGTTARLSPGRYTVKATLEGRVLDDGSKPVATVTTSVGGGGSRLNLVPVVGDVDVTVLVGKTAWKLPVGLTLPGAEKAFIVRDTDDKGVVRFAVSPQKLEVATRLETAHGPIDVKKVVDVRGGKNAITLVIDRGAIVQQVKDAGAAVAATVRYTAKPTKPPPKKGPAPVLEPLLGVKAGETAWLPPGVYLVEVERLGDKKSFGEVKIVAGTTVDAPIEWAPVPAPAPTAPLTTTTTTPAVTGKADAAKADPAKPAPAGTPPATPTAPATATTTTPAPAPTPAPSKAPKKAPAPAPASAPAAAKP